MSEEIDKHVTRKYDVAQKLGKGAYGIVWKAVDKKTRDTVAALARLDMPGAIRSLNVSNAAAIALYAATRHLSATP